MKRKNTRTTYARKTKKKNSIFSTKFFRYFIIGFLNFNQNVKLICISIEYSYFSKKTKKAWVIFEKLLMFRLFLVKH